MEDRARNPMRVVQAVVIALFLGTVLALALFAGLRMAGVGGSAETSPLLTCLAFATGAVGLVSRILVPALLDRQARRRMAAGEGDPGDELAAVHRVRAILAAALLEGPALLCAIAYYLEGEPATLVLGALLALGIVAGFPTRSQADGWIRAQQRDLSS